jgi:hypothetical protein
MGPNKKGLAGISCRDSYSKSSFWFKKNTTAYLVCKKSIYLFLCSIFFLRIFIFSSCDFNYSSTYLFVKVFSDDNLLIVY